MILVNWGCGTHYAPKPWINTDVVSNEEVHPDIIIDSKNPFKQWKKIDKLFASHILEHIPWQDIPDALGKAYDVLADDGEMLVIGPDFLKTLNLWKKGMTGYWLVEAIMERDVSYDYGAGENSGGRHWWNCDSERVEKALNDAGFKTKILKHPPAEWPAMNWDTSWQLCIMATKK